MRTEPRPPHPCSDRRPISLLGSQVTSLALAWTAAVVLHAAPAEMGLIGWLNVLPFVLRADHFTQFGDGRIGHQHGYARRSQFAVALLGQT